MIKQVKAGLWMLLLGTGLVWFVWDQFNQPGQRLTDTNGPVYTLAPSFDTESLNNRMLVSHAWPGPGFHLAPDQSLARLLPAIRQTFRRNPHPDAVLHGNSALVPVGWAYIELRNATNQPRPLVLSMPQYRCNQATLWIGQKDRFALVGTLRNNTPLGDRFYPFFNYAFPFTIPPQTTVPLLLRTRNYASFHEVDVRLSRQRTYAEAAYIDSIRDGANVVVFLILALVALLVGWLSKSQLLRWFGAFLVSLSVMSASHLGHLSLLPYPDWQSVNADTIGTFCRILINAMVHPFFYEMIKPAIRHPRRYKLAMLGYCAASALLMGLHLLPRPYYDHLNYGINVGMVSLTNINVAWLLVCAVLAYGRERIWSPLAICLLALIPLVLSQIVSIIRAVGEQDTYRQAAPSPLYVLLVLIYLTFDQFRKELVTRQRMQAQIREVGEHNDALRREEIESIGRDLHDQVGNTLATALGYLGRRPVNPDKLRTIIVSAIGELRFLSHNLVKDDDRPLTDKIDTLVSRFNDFSAIRLSFADYTHGQIDQLATLKQQNIYRIIQELLTNVIRHSGATQANVQFFCDGTTVDVSVEDDGTGFDVSAGQTSGIGIQTIYKRAALSGIEVRFDATPAGTTVLLQTTLNDLILSNANPNYSYR